MSGVHRLRAVVRRDLIIEFSYHLRLIVRFAMLLASLFFVFYVSDFVGVPAGLEGYQGTYFDFVVVGLALTMYLGLGVGGFVARVDQEQASGTFEVLLAGPTRVSTILLSGLVVPFMLTTVELVILLAFGLGVIGSGIGWGALAIAAPLLIVSVLSFSALGIMSAALVVLAKRGDVLSVPLYQATLAFSGVLFPVEVLPAGLRLVPYAFPSFYGLRGLRDALLGGAGFVDVADDLAIVSAFCVVLLPLSLWLFGRAIAAAKRAGVLGNY